MAHPLPPKKEVALALLERSKVHIHLDPRKEGVIVPAHFRKQPQLVLEIGLNMPIPIPDLRLDDDGMTCTLSFSRQPFYCAVPWPSVFAMLGDDGRGMVWPDDVPAELQPQAKPAESPKPRAVTAKSRPQPAPVADASEPSSEKSQSDKSDKSKPKRASRSKKPRIAVVENPPERPVLVALPAPPEPKGPRPVPNAKKRPAHPPARSGGKTKRELPPYLRVVK